MQTDNRLFDDFAKVMGGAVGAFSGLRNEFEQWVKGQVEGLLGRMDLVTREEFEAVRAMAEKARGENEALAARIAALEVAAAAKRDR